MMAQALPVPRIRPLGWALIGFRLLLVCTPLHLAWRALHLGRWWPRIFLSGIGMISGLHLRVEGRPAKGALLLANHVSWLDVPALAHSAGSAFVAHDGLAAFPLLKWLCEMNDTVFIARHDRASIGLQVQQIRAAMAERGRLTLFPEGTTSDGTALLPFKSSLLSALDPLPQGAVVQPVLLAYEDAARIAWIGEEHGLDNFKRILARLRPVRLTLVFLPPLDEAALADRKTISAIARGQIAAAMAR
jgi:1-acyl-sn-glycerol-3-phosphate acyltransferase